MRLRSMQAADDLVRKSKDEIARYIEEYDDNRTQRVRANTLAEVRTRITEQLVPGDARQPLPVRLAAVDMLLRLLADIEEGRTPPFNPDAGR